MLLHIEKVYTTHHAIKLIDRNKFLKVNINVLWVPRRKKGEFSLRTRGNKNCPFKKMGKPC
jgi:hypothetical protein